VPNAGVPRAAKLSSASGGTRRTQASPFHSLKHPRKTPRSRIRLADREDSSNNANIVDRSRACAFLRVSRIRITSTRAMKRFAASRGLGGAFAQFVSSPAVPAPRHGPFSLSHLPVGCYCRLSSPSLIKSFVLRRRRLRAVVAAATRRKISQQVPRPGINVEACPFFSRSRSLAGHVESTSDHRKRNLL